MGHLLPGPGRAHPPPTARLLGHHRRGPPCPRRAPQGDRGVFITTSSFTRGALLEAERINARIELIDGARLARLLVQYGVGVQESHTVVLHRIDEDFFEEI
ncbi:restriction endonuclease [Dietzia kunjamensis]|uniref:restriction endonuclease n=1 Tax=Dietzia kunjamensis TaxID=322509 RepID=UPI0039BD3C79